MSVHSPVYESWSHPCICVPLLRVSWNRPVPLSQTFIGITEKNAMKRLMLMNEMAFELALDALRKGKQVRCAVAAAACFALRDLRERTTCFRTHHPSTSPRSPFRSCSGPLCAP
jgi:hypothetical protein